MTFRPDPKPEPKLKKQPKPIRKITPEKKQEKDEIHQLDEIFYRTKVWNERPHQCEICGKKLTFFSFSWFHHLLRKGEAAFAHLRHQEKNIIMVCQLHHDMFHWAYPPLTFVYRVNAAYKYFQSIKLLPS